MRKRKYLIGATLALAVAVAMPSLASAAPTGQTLDVVVKKVKQDKKKRGAADIDVTVDTQYAPGSANPGQTAFNTVVDFDKDFVFNPGKLPKCNPTQLANTTTAAAKAACGGSEVGAGEANLCSTANASVCLVSAVVTAFNGTPVGGNPQLLLHTRTSANTTSVLDGTLINSPLGGQYGKRLNVNVPDTGQLGQTLVHFRTAVPKQVTKRRTVKNKKTGKKQVIKTFYVSARCGKGKSWQFQETTQFRAGGGTHTASDEVKCKRKK